VNDIKTAQCYKFLGSLLRIFPAQDIRRNLIGQPASRYPARLLSLRTRKNFPNKRDSSRPLPFARQSVAQISLPPSLLLFGQPL
jgi:hypothetical protein